LVLHPLNAVKKEKASKQKAEAGGSAGGSGGEGAPEFVELGNRKRASISEFKGKKLLNLREYYEKDGQVAFLTPFFAFPHTCTGPTPSFNYFDFCCGQGKFSFLSDKNSLRPAD